VDRGIVVAFIVLVCPLPHQRRIKVEAGGIKISSSTRPRPGAGTSVPACISGLTPGGLKADVVVTNRLRRRTPTDLDLPASAVAVATRPRP
jgi:hypothetical protein